MSDPETGRGQERSGASPDPFVGRLVAGRFRVLDLIARGGMGRVYRAEQVPLGRLCALKILHPRYEDDDDPEFQRRFFLEAATAAQLTHPNTVTVFDYGRDADTYFIAMEYLEGRTLYRVLREDGPLEEPRVVRILQQAARSLREAHHLGVIHRDMKPGNVLLLDVADEPDTVKVLDFGLVKRVDENQEDLTQEGMFMGSPKYMAPEQILGNPVSPATDVYALGVVAYELLTGLPPFDEGTSVKTMMAHLHRPVPAIEARMRGAPLSPELAAIVGRCLAKEPFERYETTDDLLRALHLIGGGTLTESLVGAQLRLPPSRGELGRSTGAGPRVPTLEVALERESDRTETQTLVSGPPTLEGDAPRRIPEAAVTGRAEAQATEATKTAAPSAPTDALRDGSSASALTPKRAIRLLVATALLAVSAVVVVVTRGRPDTSAASEGLESASGRSHPSAMTSPPAVSAASTTVPVPSPSAEPRATSSEAPRDRNASDAPPRSGASAEPLTSGRREPELPSAASPKRGPEAPRGYKSSPY